MVCATQTTRVSSYFNVGEDVWFGRWKNKRGRVVRLYVDDRGVPMVEIEPIPKGRKKNRTFSLFKIWKAEPTKTGSLENPLMSEIAARVATRFASSDRYARLLVSMSLQEAKAVLGFPPGYSPTPEEVTKAWRRKAIENHPDRGGDHDKMVEVNVAKDILEGKGRATWRPEPPPPAARPQRQAPEVMKTLHGVDFKEALSKSGLPAGVDWKCLSRPVYVSVQKEPNSYGGYRDVWAAIGVDSGGEKIWVVAAKRRGKNFYFDPELGGRVDVEEDWEFKSAPCFVNPAKNLPKFVTELCKSFRGEDVKAPAPKKWVAWPGGPLSKETFERGQSSSSGAALKDVLLSVGLVKDDDPAVSGRKSTVQIIPRLNLEKGKKIRQEQGGKLYGYQVYDYEVQVNGKTEKLKDETTKNLEKNGFVMAVFDYNPSNGQTKNLSQLRGSRFKINATNAIRLLADSLTTEASWLHIALEKAAEELEGGTAKTADEADYDFTT